MDEQTEPATMPPARRRRWPRVLMGLLLTCALGAGAGVAWLASEGALRQALARAVAASQGQLTIEGAQGSLLTQVRVARLSWQGEAVDVEVREAALSWNLWDLISRRFTVTHLSAGALGVKLHKAAGSRNGLPASLELPLEVEVRQVRVRNLEWVTPQGQGAVSGIAFSYAGGAASHRIADLRLSIPEGDLTGAVEIGALAPFALRGDLAFAGVGAWQAARVAVKVAGPIERFDVVADGTLRDASVAARIVATPFADLPFFSAELDARALNLARWDANGPVTDLTLMLVVRPESDRFVGTIDARNARAGPIDAARIPAESLTARFAWQDGTLALEDAAVRIAGGGTATGRITMAPRGGASDGALQLRQVDLARIQSTLPTTRLSGTLAAEVAGTRQSVRGSLRDDAPGGPRVGARSVDFAAVVDGQRVHIDSFRAQAGGGTLAGRGNLALDGRRAFSVSARATNFDPSRFADLPPGLLKGTIDASGTLAPAWDVSADLTLDAGSKFAETAVSGRARVLATPGRATGLDLKLRAASATLALEGAWGGVADRLQFALDAPRLAELRPLLLHLSAQWPDALDGAVKLKGALSGTPRNPGLDLDAHAKALQWGETLRAAAIDVAATVAPGTETSVALDKRALHIAVLGTGLAAPQGELKTARIEVKGSLARHQGAASAAGAGFAVDAAFSGGLEERKGSDGKVDLTWSGSLARLTHAGQVALALEAPATLVVSRSRVALGSTRIAIAEGRADIERLTVEAGRIDTRGSFTGIPVTAVAWLAGSTLPFTSTLVLGGDWNLLAAPKLNGGFSVQRERGDVYAAEEAGLDDAERAFGLTALGLTGRFLDGALDASALLRTARGGSADATLGIAAPAAPGAPVSDAALRGTLRADMTTLRSFQPWLGTAAAIDGRARLDVQVGGTLARPSYSGALTGDALRLAFPQHGVQFQEGRLRARLVDRAIVLDELSMAGGAGRLVAEGTWAQARADASEPAAGGARVDLRWRADQLTLVNQPELQIVAGGSGRVTLTDRRLLLNGTVDVVRGNVTLAPVVAGRLSDDVVIVGRPRAPADTGGTRAVPLSLDIDLGLGPNFRFSGGGLESRLEGRVRVTNDAAGVLFAKGTIRAAEGTYTAFGQRLVIDRGNLIFGGRADNPGLDVLALRRNLAVEAGVEVQGTVRAPIVRLVSNPPVPEGEQLSWLITGQGLDRASSADLLALSAASASLLSGGQRPLASLLQSRLGVDDVSVRDAGSAAGGGPSGQVIALSRRISDRLSVVYEHGLTAAHNALRMEYALSQTLTLRASAGTVGSFGVYFWRAFN